MIYRIGNPNLGVPRSYGIWWGTCWDRFWGTFEAPSDREAWEKGQELWGGSVSPSSGHVIALEREMLVPRPILLSGPEVTIHGIQDKNPRGQSIWVRVAVGIHGAPWQEPCAHKWQYRETFVHTCTLCGESKP